MPEKQKRSEATAKSPSKSAPKSPPKTLTSITRPSTSSGTPNPRGTKPSGPGATRPPLANQHDRVRVNDLEDHENVITHIIMRTINGLKTRS